MNKNTNKVIEEKKRLFNKKNTSIIAIILTIIVIIGIGTYALSLWTSSENTELTMRIGTVAEVVFDTGNNIDVSNIGPVFNYETDGEITTFAVTNFTAEETPIVVNFKVTSITDHLKSKHFKCALMASTDNGTNYTKINEVSFENASNGKTIKLYYNYSLPANNSVLFKTIFYIDGNELNSNSIQGGSLSGFIQVKAGVLGDVVINNLPIPTGPYTVDTSGCTDMTMTYDYLRKGFIVSNMSVGENATCDLIVTSTTRTTLSSYIVGLLNGGTSVASEGKSGNGSTIEKITANGEEDYRYRGINPNNYVLFNNELWRIIGVFDEKSHGITGKKLVKIIRNDTIGAYNWSETGNNFPDSTIYKILNTAYYNHIDATGQSYCLTDDVPGKCNFTGIGIQDEYKNMIESNVNWFLGGYSSIAINSSAMYLNERASGVVSGNDVSTYAAGVITPVGLMYASDYGYAAPSSCSANLSAYTDSGCSNLDWLKHYYSEWLLTHYSDSSGTVANIHYEGKVSNSLITAGATSPFSVRPVVYLKENVFRVSGTGTQIDPYIVAID